MKQVHLLFFLFLLINCSPSEKKTRDPVKTAEKETSSIIKITNDGTWCWFSDPRAIYMHGIKPGVLTGWVTKDGDIEVAHIDTKGEIDSEILADTLDKDDHANPAFVALNNDRTMVFYTKHFDEYVRYHHQEEGNKLFQAAVLFDPFDEKELEKFPLRRTTYANPCMLKDEGGKIYCFGRWTGFKPNMITSVDNGMTFSKSKVLITNYPFDSGNRPYAKYYSDGKSKIHIAFTDGHPRVEPANSVYYAYYEQEAFNKVDGTKICDIDKLPFEPGDASLVYQATKENGKSWVFDLAADQNGHPVVLYTRYPDDYNHVYYYAKYNGNEWKHTKICHSGKWFPQTIEGEIEKEPNYSGGMTLSPRDPSIVFTSEKINNVFEIVKYKLDQKGNVSARKEITRQSEFDNVRPFVPRNMKKGDKLMVLWMRNEKYVHYTDYKTGIYAYRED